jgi:DNA-binding beta-propeller fold protein YncE
VEARLRGEADPAELAAWQAHLQASPNCRAAYQQDRSLNSIFELYRADPFFDRLNEGWRPDLAALEPNLNGRKTLPLNLTGPEIASGFALENAPPEETRPIEEIPLLPPAPYDIAGESRGKGRWRYWQLTVAAVLLAGLLVLGSFLIAGITRPSTAPAARPTPNLITRIEFVGQIQSGKNQFAHPGGLAVDERGNLFVVDNFNHLVEKFDSRGDKLLEWGSFGTAEGQFDKPWGIAVDSQGSVYVADTGNNRIQKFDNNGNFLLAWGSGGPDDGLFTRAQGIAVDRQGNVYVSDSRAHRVQKFDNKGSFLLKWGSAGSGNGQFNLPGDLAVDGQGNVYVADPGNSRVEKFDGQGHYLAQWGSAGTQNGQFSYPQLAANVSLTQAPGGLAVDPNPDRPQNIYVADFGNGRLQKFDGQGRFLLSASGPSQFTQPQSLALDNQGNIYLTDIKTNKVLKFRQVLVSAP